MAPPEVSGPETPVYRVEDRQIPGPGGTLAFRVYTPCAGTRLPGLMYFHGGGFVLGGLDMNDRPCRMLANASGCVVVSVDYRLAPEHPYPAAVDDAYAATKFVAEHAPEFGIDRARLGVAGDSAGGNLATVTAIKSRDLGGPALAFQLLVYPQVDCNDDSPSMREFGTGHFLDVDGMAYFLGHYCPGVDDRRQPYASPILADLGDLPPAFVITAECDPLRDQGEAYVRKLREAGVAVEHKRYDGMIHPFFSLAGIVDAGRTAIADAAVAAARVLG
jgi:acetyl esterase